MQLRHVYITTSADVIQTNVQTYNAHVAHLAARYLLTLLALLVQKYTYIKTSV